MHRGGRHGSARRFTFFPRHARRFRYREHRAAIGAACALGTILLAAFVLAERRVSHPLLPLRVILDRTRGGSYVAIGFTGVAIFGVFLFLTYYMQQVKGSSPVTTGLLFLPMVGGILVASTLSSVVLLPRVGPRVLIASGLLLAGGGTAYLGQLTVTSSYLGNILLPGRAPRRRAGGCDRAHPRLRRTPRPHRHATASGNRHRSP